MPSQFCALTAGERFMAASNSGRAYFIKWITTLMKFMSEGLLVLDSCDRIEFANAVALELFGCLSIDEMHGKHINEIYACANQQQDSRRDQTAIGRECIFRKMDGQTFTASFTEVSLQDIDDQVPEKIILLQDLTEEKKLTIELNTYKALIQKKIKQLDEFSYIVSHDLKAPLRAITNLSVWLQEDLSDSLSEENTKNLELLRGRVSRMEALITGIHAYSQIGRECMQNELVDVKQLISEVIDELAPSPNVSIELRTEMPMVQTSKRMLHKVFSNLISNAIIHNDKPQIVIGIYSEETDKMKFVIEDNGPGISVDYHETIFGIFQTLKARDKFESVGLGLALVRRILEEWGGAIHLESQPGRGSKFIFEWPIHSLVQNSLSQNPVLTL